MTTEQNTKVRFLRDINLDVPYDFNQNVKDKIKREIDIRNNNQINKIEIDDFLHILKIENLTEKSYDEVIENSFNIHFTSINLNFKEHTDRSPKTLTKKSIVDFRFPSYWFIAFSTNYSFVNQTKTTLTIKMSNDDITFDIQKLKRARITYEIND